MYPVLNRLLKKSTIPKDYEVFATHNSIKEECLDQLILFGERSLRHALDEYLAHHQHERNHQGLHNVIPFPSEQSSSPDGTIRKSERLGGLLNFYQRAA